MLVKSSISASRAERPCLGEEAAAAFDAKPVGRASRLIHSAALSVIDQGVFSGTRFATTVLIGRTCGQSELGVYYLTMSVAMFVLGIQSQVIRAPYIVHCPRRSGRSLQTYNGSVLVHQLVLAALSVAIVLAAGAIATLAGVATGIGGTLLLLGVVITPLLLREFIRGWTIAHFEMSSLLTVDGAVASLQLAALGALAWFDLLNVPIALLVIGASCLVSAAAWMWTRRASLRFARARIVADWRENWSFSRWALLSHLFGSTSPIMIAWILTAVRDTDATGRFAASMTIAAMAHVVVGGLANLAAPRAARAFAEGGARLVRRCMVTTAAMLGTPALIFVMVALFGAEQLAIWVYGNAFAGCGLTVIALGLWFLANNLGIAAGCSLWAIGQPRANLPADIVSFVLTGLLGVYGSYYHGADGAAWALFVGVLGGTLIRWTTASRQIARMAGSPLPTRLESAGAS